MSNSTKILLKRTQELLSNIKTTPSGGIPMSFGEPLLIDNNTVWGDTSTRCNSFLAIGSPVDNGTINQAVIFKGFWDPTVANSLVFFKDNREGLVDESGNPVYADGVIVDSVDINSYQYDNVTDYSDRFYLLCQSGTQSDLNPDYRKVKKFELNDAGIYITSKGILHGAAWNDYAEKREIIDNVEPGDIVCEVGDGTLSLSSERLQVCPYVVSDTYGFVIGKEEDIPIAVSGRALVKVEDEKISVGDCLCAGIGGKAYVMSRQEIVNYPDRILGIVTEIPEYEEWNGKKVNKRVWIKIK